MEKILTFLETHTERWLTHRKQVKAFEAAKPKTVVGEILSWIDALLFAIVVVILINQYLFQLFVIPSPSMVHTMEIGDRVFVGKNAYGTELWAAGKKVGTKNRLVNRDDIITFYNPEYKNKGLIFNILSQFIYSGTFTLVNIDRNEDGTPAERLLVKRAVGFPGESVIFDKGHAYIRKAGSTAWEEEDVFREENGLVRSTSETSAGPHLSNDPALYESMDAWGTLIGWQDTGASGAANVPQYLLEPYKAVQNQDFPWQDFYEFSKYRMRAKHARSPENLAALSDYASYAEGIYVGKNQVLPLGDNRDNSRDGRYFGPVWQKNVNGRVYLRFWPLGRVKYLGNS